MQYENYESRHNLDKTEGRPLYPCVHALKRAVDVAVKYCRSR